jgi:hypothetical protein
MHGDDAAPHTEVEQLLLQDPRIHDQAVAVVAARALGRQLEHRHVRTLVGADRPSLVELEGLLAPLRGARLAAVVDDLRLDPLLSTRSRRREVV